MGFNVIEANTAERALAELERGESIDLLFTDIVLPGAMDGCALARKAISRDRPPKILLTSDFPAQASAPSPTLGRRAAPQQPYRQDELVVFCAR